VGVIAGLLEMLFPPAPEPIGELRPGASAFVRGRVVPRDLIESPLTGDRCVYYQYTVENWRRSEAVVGDGFWEIVDSDEAIAEFYLQDESGVQAIVAPQRARVERARGVHVRTLDLGADRQRAQQLVILPGAEIEVVARVGQAEDLYDEARGYRASPTRLILLAPEDGEIVIRLLA
jgi:hypothetical protein